jgi:hypothetical protein
MHAKMYITYKLNTSGPNISAITKHGEGSSFSFRSCNLFGSPAKELRLFVHELIRLVHLNGKRLFSHNKTGT